MVENGSSGGSSGRCSMGDDSHPYTPFMLWHAATPVLDPGPRGHRQQRQSPTQPHPNPAMPHALVWNNSWPKLDYY